MAKSPRPLVDRGLFAGMALGAPEDLAGLPRVAERLLVRTRHCSPGQNVVERFYRPLNCEHLYQRETVPAGSLLGASRGESDQASADWFGYGSGCVFG